MAEWDDDNPQESVEHGFPERQCLIRIVFTGYLCSVSAAEDASRFHFSGTLAELAVDLVTFNYKHQFRIQIDAANVHVAGADDTDGIIHQNRLGMERLVAPIFDLLDAWVEKKTEFYRKQTHDFAEWDDGVKFVLHHFQENAQLVYHVFDSLSRERMERYIFTTVEELFYEYMKRRTADARVSGEALEWISQAYCYAILGFVLKFLWEKMDIDIDTSVDKLYQLFNGALEDAVKRVEANEA